MDRAELANQILDEAVEVLEKDGWIRGSLHRFGKHCLLGAISKAEQNLRDQRLNGEIGQKIYSKVVHEYSQAETVAQKKLAGVLSVHRNRGMRPMDKIMTWNDTYCKNARQAIRKLRKASRPSLWQRFRKLRKGWFA